MKGSYAYGLLLALALVSPGRAQDEHDEHAHSPPPTVCNEKADTEAKIHAKHGTWITVTTDQWEFLRGVYTVNPNTPPGMPPGDRAVLARIEGEDGGMIFWIEGVLACNPMVVPKELVKVLLEIDAENVAHVGAGT